jgi:hypothetical protein
MITRAAETIAWFACGGERDDYQCDYRYARMVRLWLGWEIATNRLVAKARDMPRRGG